MRRQAGRGRPAQISHAESSPAGHAPMTDDATRRADALSAKRKAFVEVYCKCWNARRAARAAGYTESRCGHAYDVLRRDDIQAAIEEWKQQPPRAYALLKQGLGLPRRLLPVMERRQSGRRRRLWRALRLPLARRDDIRAALIEPAGAGRRIEEVIRRSGRHADPRAARQRLLDYAERHRRAERPSARLRFSPVSPATRHRSFRAERGDPQGRSRRRGPAAEVANLRLDSTASCVPPTAPAPPADRRRARRRPGGRRAPQADADRDRAKAILTLFAKVKREADQSAE